MDKYKHISEMENILINQENNLNKLESVFNVLNEQLKDYEALVKYYYSEQRNKDLEHDEKGLIPSTINRGVLSEDQIYNLIIGYKEVLLEIMEVGLKYIKV